MGRFNVGDKVRIKSECYVCEFFDFNRSYMITGVCSKGKNRYTYTLDGIFDASVDEVFLIPTSDVPESEQSSDNNGGKTDYYQLPDWVKDADDFAEWRGMDFFQGNILKSVWCFNTQRHSGTNEERELNKIIHYAQKRLNKIRKEKVNGK